MHYASFGIKNFEVFKLNIFFVTDPSAITKERLQYVDFTIPVYTDSIVGMIPCKEEKVADVIMRPFDWKIWICVAGVTATFLLAFAFSDLAFNGYIRWRNLIEFTYRLMLMHSADLQPVKPILFPKFSNFYIFILGSPILITPERGRQKMGKMKFSQPE